MPAPRHRTSRFRKLKKKAPGGRALLHYKERKPKVAHCASCRTALKGIPRLEMKKARKLGKTKKRPERAYGGMLCSKCSRRKLVEKARA